MPESKFEILDLHTIALLIDYERISGPVSDPRFRHTKLCEMASPDGSFATIPGVSWDETPLRRTKHGFVLGTTNPSNEGDLPSTMLDPLSEQSLFALTEGQLETIFHQIRGHDGCFQIIAILQAFAKFYNDDQPIHIRLPDGTGFLSTLSNRYILEYTLRSPKQTTLSITLPSPSSKPGTPWQYRFTGESSTMLHAVWGFSGPDKGSTVVLDVASMQFGEVGRGSSGHFFILQKQEEWEAFADKIAKGRNEPKVSLAVRSSGNSELKKWFLQVARRVKERWDERGVARFCGLCGKPDAKKRCAWCKREYYCSEAHGKAAWENWHKQWCSAS